MNDREIAIVLAALRHWQRTIGHIESDFRSIATDGGRFDPLSDNEIDQLCKNLSVGHGQHMKTPSSTPRLGPQPFVLMHEHEGGVGLYQFNYMPSGRRPHPDEKKVARKLGIACDAGDALTLTTLEGVVPTLHADDVGWDRVQDVNEPAQPPALDDIPRAIVVVQGGVVQAIFADRPLNADVLDHDNWHATDPALDPDEWKRFAALAQEIDAGKLLEQLY